MAWGGKAEAQTGAGTRPKSLNQSSKEPGLLTPSSFYFWDHVWGPGSGQSIEEFKFYLSLTGY